MESINRNPDEITKKRKTKSAIMNFDNLMLELNKTMNVGSTEAKKVKIILTSAFMINATYEQSRAVIDLIKNRFEEHYIKIYLSICCNSYNKEIMNEHALIIGLRRCIRFDLIELIESQSNDDVFVEINSLKKCKKDKIVLWIMQNRTIKSLNDEIVNNMIIFYTYVVLQGIREDIVIAEDIILSVYEFVVDKNNLNRHGVVLFNNFLWSSDSYSEFYNIIYFTAKMREEIFCLEKQTTEFKINSEYISKQNIILEKENSYILKGKEETENLIAKLQFDNDIQRKEIDVLRKRAEFERMNFEEQLMSGKNHLISELSKPILMEISQARETTLYINTVEAARIEKRLNNIEKIIRLLRGE